MAESQSWPDPSVVPPPDITSSTGGPISAPGAALGDQQFPGVGVDPYSATALASPRPKKQTSAPASVDQIPIGPEAEINKAAGYDPATGRIQPGGIYDLTRQKQEATEAADQRLINAEQEQLRQLREAHKAVAASPNDLKSWDAQKEQAKYSVSPTEAALNPGFWLAIAASAFTRTPMVNALNGAAASINSLKDGKDEEFKRAYDAWRQNSELAVKRHEMMHQDYEDAIQLYGKDVDMAREQAKLVALKYDDKLALEYLRNGLDDKMIGLVDKRDQMFKDWSQTNAALPEHQVRQDVYSGMMKQINDLKQQRNLPNNAPEIIALRNRAAVALGAKTDQDEAQAQVMFQWQLDHANDHDGNGPTAEEVFNKTNAVTYAASEAKKGHYGAGGPSIYQSGYGPGGQTPSPTTGAPATPKPSGGAMGPEGQPGPTEAAPGEKPTGQTDRDQKIQLAMNDENTPEARAELAQMMAQVGVKDVVVPPQGDKSDLLNHPFGGRQLNEGALDGLKPQARALIRLMVEGKIAPPTGFQLGGRNGEFWQDILQHASEYDPNFDAKMWPVRVQIMKDIFSGYTQHNVIRRFGTVAQHIGQLDDNQTKLNQWKAGDFPEYFPMQTLTYPYAWGLEAHQGGVINSVKIDGYAVANELEAAFKGSRATIDGIKEWAKSTSNVTLPLDTSRTNNIALIKLIEGQMNSVIKPYNDAFGTDLPGMALLAPETRAVFDKLISLQDGRDAIQQGVPRAAVINRLREHGIDPSGL